MIPLLVVHITVLSIMLENTISSSLEIMRIVANPISACFRFNVCAWSLIIVNITLFYMTIFNLDQTSETTSPNTESTILTDDEVFEYFPTNLFEYSNVHCVSNVNHRIQSFDEFDQKDLLASMHRDFMSIDRQNPCESNPFGLGQTPTQICSRME